VSNTDVLRQAYAAFASGDMPQVLATLHDQIEWTEPAGHVYAGFYTGPEAVVQNIFIPLSTDWDRYLVEPDTFIGEGDQVAALGWVSGTYKATGIAVRARFVHWWTMTDGRAIRFEAIEDTVKIAEAVSVPVSQSSPGDIR
jgi:ketosteroid isomerase-like protein